MYLFVCIIAAAFETQSVARKSFVELDEGDKGQVPNGYIHKMVRFGGGMTRFGGSYLIHWDTKLDNEDVF